MFSKQITQDAYLKPLCSEDSEPLFELTDQNRDHLREWLPWVDATKSSKDTAAFIRLMEEHFHRTGCITAGIWYSGKISGVVGQNKIDPEHQNTSLGYWLGKEFQGKGLVTAACAHLIEHAFENKELERVEIRCAPNNLKSRSVAERLGFSLEGELRNAEKLYGTYVNHCVYSLLASEKENIDQFIYLPPIC